MLQSMRSAEAWAGDDRGRSARRASRSSFPSTTKNGLWPAASDGCGAISTESFPFSTVVTVVDNGSTDATALVAAGLAAELEGVRAVRLTEKGRGRALRAAWSTSTARVVAYTDVDLSTSLDALLPLVAPLLSGHSDVAIGTRLAPGARVVRGPKRELISRIYNLVLKTILGNGFSDAQCGFKAARTEVAQKLLPLVEDNAWFFDTEFLVLAERSGFRIHEVPVDWVDDPDSRVDIVQTARDDLRGVWPGLCLGRGSPAPIDDGPRISRRRWPASPGSAWSAPLPIWSSSSLWPVPSAGSAPMPWPSFSVPRPTPPSTAATPSPGGADRRARNLVLGGSAALSTSLAGHVGGPDPRRCDRLSGRPAVASVLVVANAGAALVRFLVLRGWMFRTATSATSHPSRPGAGSGDLQRKADRMTMLVERPLEDAPIADPTEPSHAGVP